MKVALFSDVITMVGEGHIPDHVGIPYCIDDQTGKTYTNFGPQGGVTVPKKFRDCAAYVLNPNPASKPSATLFGIVMLEQPISTQGA